MLPSSYLESRTRFADHARDLGAAVHRFELHADERAGPGLSTDTVVLGPPGAPNIIVIASGTHGVEGYCGAACQLHFMRCYQAVFARRDTAYLLVHAVNPWGFFQDRRVTQEGIDLNRNFIDFPLAARPSAYGAYHGLLVSNFRPLPAGLGNELRLLSLGLTRRRRRAMQEAITAGQQDYPDGLFFCGSGPARSRLVWETILQTFVAGRRRAVLLDIHTGLGRRGAGELLSHQPASSPVFRRIDKWLHGGLRSMAGGESISAAVEGTLAAGFERSAAPESYGIGLEFGTRSQLAVLRAMRADQWCHNNAARLTDADRAWARQKMKSAFRVPDPRWHAQIVARFEQVVKQLADGVSRA
jgi:hypothetical protein